MFINMYVDMKKYTYVYVQIKNNILLYLYINSKNLKFMYIRICTCRHIYINISPPKIKKKRAPAKEMAYMINNYRMNTHH